MNFKVLRNIFRQVNRLEINSINQNGRFLLIENVNEFPLRINTFLIKDSFNDCNKSIIRTISNEIRNKKHSDINKLYFINLIFYDCVIYKLNDKNLNQKLFQFKKDERVRLNYVNVNEKYFFNI
tara:strand:- start:2 stop:373 length:372 start_codon:yes stop_codon:yes gene_type:complete